MPRSPYDPSHGDRVQIRFGGPAGTVIRRPKSGGIGHYFKARLDLTGEWVWLDDAVAESTGAHELRCADCEIRFLSDDLHEVHCPNCIRRMSGQDPGTRRSRFERHVRGGDR